VSCTVSVFTWPSSWLTLTCVRGARAVRARGGDEMFAQVDALDARGFASFFTDGGVFP
jgi:hypothetical protein